MKTKLTTRLLFLGIMLFAQVSFAQAEYTAALYTGKKGTLPYRILLPDGYTPTRSYPLLIFLHGAGERGNDNQLQLTHGSGLFQDPLFRKKYPAIVVFPQCKKEGYWATVVERKPPKFVYNKRPRKNPQQKLLVGLINTLEKQYSIDNKRVYVGGLSMGGMGTFELVYQQPKRFAAAFAICGGAHPKIARRIRRPAWRIDHGEEDEVVDVSLSIKMVEALEDKGAKVIFNTYPKVNHNSWNNVFADPDFLPWLFSQSK